MVDQIDQYNEAAAIAAGKSGERTTHVITYVYQIDGEWHNVTYEGTLADCGEAAMKRVARQGAVLDKIRWARGHMDGNRLVVHPKMDAQAEAEIIKVMARKPKPKQVHSRN